MFTLSELKAIAEIVRQYPNLVVISDEVYKYTVHSPFEEGDKYSVGHYHFARLPGMELSIQASLRASIYMYVCTNVLRPICMYVCNFAS